MLMKPQSRQHGSEYTNQEDNTNRYAIASIIEKTQKLQAVYWFNLNSFLGADLKHAEAISLSWLQLPSVCP